MDTFKKTTITTKRATGPLWLKYGSIFRILYAGAVFCLVVVLVSLVFGLASLATFFGWIGILVAIVALVLGLVFTLG